MKQDEYPKFEAGNRKPFTLPENYFADFAEKIVEQTSSPKVDLKPRRTLRIWMSAAAAVVGIIIASTLLLQVYQQSTYNEDESYEMYIAAQLTDDVYYDYYVTSNNN